MATAVKPSTESGTPNPRLKLVVASAVGALFVLAGIAVAAYLVPMLWEQAISPVTGQLNSMVDGALRLVVQGAVIGAIIWGGTFLAGANPPRGLRGGILLVLVSVVAIFFIVRAVGLGFEDTSYGTPLTFVTLGVLLGGAYKLLTSQRAERWMYAIDEQGWMHVFLYKKTQGLRLRRYTIIGALLIGWSGVYTLVDHATLGTGDWVLTLPFGVKPVTILYSIQYSVPVILAALTFWLAWRAVNVPAFADFLIATEAEMNKVSWSTRKRLTQDTIVVLITVAFLTAFLLLVDLFWGWLLSRELVGVLPSKSNTPAGAVADPLAGKNIDW